MAIQTTPNSLPLPKPINGISEVLDDYETFIVDLWGVIHNGVAPFPGVVDCLNSMMAAGKRVCLLTNAPRRVDINLNRLADMGIPRDCFTALISSGEATHLALIDRPDAFHQSLGQTCYHLGPPRDVSVYEGVGLTMVDSPAAASFVLNTGIDAPDETLEQYMPVLERIWAKQLPMVCANPDLVVIIGENPAICAGTLAAAYEEMGGTVAYHGKPHPSVYHLALKTVGHPEGSPVLCIGDGFHTDITGASRTGLDSLFISTGIHGDVLDGGDPASPKMADLIAQYGVAPTYATRHLSF